MPWKIYYVLLFIDHWPRMQLRPEHTLAEDWMIGLFAIVLSILAFVKFAHSRKLNKLFDAFLNPRMVRQLMREEQVFANGPSLLLDLNFWFMTSLFLYFLIKRFSVTLFNDLGIHLIWISLAIIFTIYLVKYISISFIGSLFDKSYGINEYLYNVYIFNKAAGLLLIPINVALALFPMKASFFIIGTGLALITGFLSFRTVRGVKIGMDNNAKTLYLFLYLCALEFLPIALLVKQLEAYII